MGEETRDTHGSDGTHDLKWEVLILNCPSLGEETQSRSKGRRDKRNTLDVLWASSIKFYGLKWIENTHLLLIDFLNSDPLRSESPKLINIRRTLISDPFRSRTPIIDHAL